ncbi:MAG: ATP-binding cassette, subfamily multidrug efflux pump [Actinomycetota bacterium]|nr:ATP-binding cassette, subfamily multidrug efflux pump [Actinomycetota bacterium]
MSERSERTISTQLPAGKMPPKPPPLAGPVGMRWGTLGQPTERSSDFGTTTIRLMKRLLRERAGVITVVVLAFVSVTLTVLGPKMLGHATDILIRGLLAHHVDFASLHRTLATALGLFIGGAALSYLLSYMLAGIMQRTMYRLRADVEDKLNRLPLRYVDRHERGDLLSRVTNDIDNVAQTLQQTLSQMLTSVLMLVGTLAMMLWISWVLALVALVTVPVSIGTMRFIAARSRARFISQWNHTGTLNAQVEEAFTGHAIVKAFGRQHEVEARFRETNDELYDASFAAQFISGAIQPSMMVVSNLNFVAIAVLGGIRVASGAMTIGGVQAFIQYSRQFTMPLTQLASMANLFQSGIASAERVFEFLDAEEQTPDVPSTVLAEPRGRVEFDRVSFSYNPDKPLITDLSLVAEPGRTVAIVGPTGAGKTTLVNLIMRFYELDGGRILIDGHDISEMRRHDLRANMGMVLQDTWLFGGTIRENIAYGNLEATDEQILAAARATYVDRFVHSLPDGYDTHIDDEGSTVSAGEKQLITIARAFLADPAILILDEATSSVDTRTEVLIQHAMAALRSQRTSFVIAHRLSTIRDADTILVMDAGRIVEQGNHTDLLAAGGAYANLYNAQFAGAAVSEVA